NNQCVSRLWWLGAGATRREGGRLVRRWGGSGGRLVWSGTPLPSLSMVGCLVSSPGSASSAGRARGGMVAGGFGCSLDRLTPTRGRVGEEGTSGATIGSPNPTSCGKEVPDEHGMRLGSASRPDHLRRVDPRDRGGVAGPDLLPRPGPG